MSKNINNYKIVRKHFYRPIRDLPSSFALYFHSHRFLIFHLQEHLCCRCTFAICSLLVDGYACRRSFAICSMLVGGSGHHQTFVICSWVDLHGATPSHLEVHLSRPANPSPSARRVLNSEGGVECKMKN